MFQKDVKEFNEMLNQLTKQKLPWYEKYVKLALLCRMAYIKFIDCLPSIYEKPEKNMSMFITPDVYQAMKQFITKNDHSYESDGKYYLSRLGYRQIQGWTNDVDEIFKEQYECWGSFIDCLDNAKHLTQIYTTNAKEDWNLISKENAPQLIWSLQDNTLDELTQELIDNCCVSDKKNWLQQLSHMNSTSPLYSIKSFVSRNWTNFESGEVCPYNFNFILEFIDDNQRARKYCFVYSNGTILHSVHNSWSVLGNLDNVAPIIDSLARIPVNSNK